MKPFLTQRIERFFIFDVTQRLEPFSWYDARIEPSFLHDSKTWAFLTWLKELTFFEYDSKNWTLFLDDSKELNAFFFSFRCDAKNWTFFKNTTQRIELFFFENINELNENWIFSNMTQRIEQSFFEYDSKNWTLFLWIWRKGLNLFFFEFDAMHWILFSLNMTQRIESFFPWIWRKELNHLFLEYDAKNWTFFFDNMTHRIELFLIIWLKELNSFW